MELNGRERAAAEYRRAAEQLGMTPTDIARAGGIPDADTVRDFMDGTRWPRTPTRNRLEKAIGWEVGSINALLRGEPVLAAPSSPGDRVVAAIEASDLSRANKHRLIGTYYELLDQQGEGVRGA